jgi:carbonic anhydrase
MKYLPELFEQNRTWSQARLRQDPHFFDRLCDIQAPRYLWIGCSDSRVPANEIVGLPPGELFVHRNVANIVRREDPNCMAVVQYAVEVLGVRHVIVCGHYGCGGVRTVLDGAEPGGAAGVWLRPLGELTAAHRSELEAIADASERWQRLCEINVREQIRELSESDVVRGAWASGKALSLHGWIYDLRDGLLRDLNFTVAAHAELAGAYRAALETL